MNKELFDFLSYREYLLAWIASHPKKGRGLRASMATSIHCPLSHVSQVLKGVSDFTFEQSEEVNEFMGHTHEQSDYFLLLVQSARAGTPKLKKRIESQIKKIREKRLVLKERLEVKHSVSPESQAIFYSSWQYAAIHILLTIEKFQTKESIAKYLNLSLRKTSEIIEFMMSHGLVIQKNGRYQVGTTRVHLGNDSPMISKHHINWRLQAIQSLEKENHAEDLHYSSVVSISKQDVALIKSILIKTIENTKSVIRDSKEEELHSFCLDFFKI